MTDLPWDTKATGPKSVPSVVKYPAILIPIRLRHAKEEEHEAIIHAISAECEVPLREVRRQVNRWLERRDKRNKEVEDSDYESLGYSSVWSIERVLRLKTQDAPEPYLRSRDLWPLIGNERAVVRTLDEFAYGKGIDKGGKKVWSQFVGPALLALASDGRKVVAAQALILDPRLTWAATEPRNKDVKIRVTVGSLPPEAAVRLHGCREELAIAEGLETAMSYHRLTGIPCWARLGDIGSFAPPRSVRRLIMVHDGDEKADRSWEKLVRKQKRHLDSLVYHKADEGDMNDMWRRQHGET